VVRGYVEEVLGSQAKSSAMRLDRNKVLVLSNLLVMPIDLVKNAVYYPESPYTEAHLRISELEVLEIEEKGVLKALKDLYNESAAKIGRGYAVLDEFSGRARTSVF